MALRRAACDTDQLTIGMQHDLMHDDSRMAQQPGLVRMIRDSGMVHK